MTHVLGQAHTTKEEKVPGPGGLGIFVRSWHPGSKARAVVVICHGVNSHSGYYTWTAEQLVSTGLAVYALDLHGRGRSDGERFYLDKISDYVHDVHAVVGMAKSRNAGLPVFLLGHSAGGVVSCVYTLEHQADLAGLICESFAFQVAAPDFARAVVKGLSHLAPHAHVLRLKNEEFSRDPQVVDAMNNDPLIANEVQPTKTVAELVRADERLSAEFPLIGAGKPIVLCTRFRGNVDLWDPLFLDSLAHAGFRVITFDYSGLGLVDRTKGLQPGDAGARRVRPDRSTGPARGRDRRMVARRPCCASVHRTVSAVCEHAVLIGTGPPSLNVKDPEQLFYDTASKPVNTLEDEVALFFEPQSLASREAAKRSHERIAQRIVDRSAPVPIDFAVSFLVSGPRNPIFPADAVLEAVKTTNIPILHVGGDHDVSFPVENWYARNGELPTLQLLTFPRSGHGPQHEHPVAVAEHIAAFVRTTARAAAGESTVAKATTHVAS
jgi:acylglycerol lipase